MCNRLLLTLRACIVIWLTGLTLALDFLFPDGNCSEKNCLSRVIDSLYRREFYGLIYWPWCRIDAAYCTIIVLKNSSEAAYWLTLMVLLLPQIGRGWVNVLAGRPSSPGCPISGADHY